ncbi:MAG: hypothetical protein HY816_10705 [Candidatus Wallbacteria bacterium]|nr:hypothetical protein [Candidatus Wallbacteria bacterium]
MILSSVWGNGLLGAEDPPPELAAADKLWEEQNFKEAQQGYSKFLESVHPAEQLWHASSRLALSHLRMQEYDEAVKAAEETVKRFAGQLREARACRFLGTLYLTMPHWGTEKGGKFHRGRWDQGIQKDATKSDRKKAIGHLERARDLCIGFQADSAKLEALSAPDKAGLSAERIGIQFDLVGALTRFGTSDQDYWPGGGEEENPDDQTTGEEAEEMPMGRGRGRHGWGGGMQRPRGIPVDTAGKPIFAPVPQSWSAGLPDGQKVKFLLAEIEKIDPSETQDDAALAVYRRAMLARARYGAHRLQGWMNWWDGGGQPYKDAVEKAKLEELADGDVLTLLGTRIARVTLPADEDILALLRSVVDKYPKAKVAPEAQYAIGLYYQSRKQFKEAIREFERSLELFRGGPRSGSAQSQIHRIRASEIVLQQTGVQLAGDPARIPVTYRNTGSVHLVAHKLDLARYVQDFIDRVEADDENAVSGYDLENLSYALLQDRGNGSYPYLKYRGEKVAEWDAKVNDAGDHRYAHADITSPLTERGCYVVEASCAGHEQPVRNLVLLSDIAVVRKKLKDQQLCFTVDARTGQALAGVELTHFQYWSRWGRTATSWKERQHWYAQARKTTSDAEGISLFKADRKFDAWPQIVTIARGPGGAMAFAGVRYWDVYYSPSHEWAGRRSLVFTDRPVYRPLQTVKFKAWMHDYSGGQYRPVRSGRVRVTVRDSKGAEVFKDDLSPNEYGSVAAQFKLEKSAALGAYTIDLHGHSEAGGQFRVEEYKKPEFEVSVKVGSDLVRLGESVDGKVEARYYFGAPVTKAKATYKIFREEYTHSFVSPGYWDWLYGPGYGRCFYSCEWLPWWKHYGPRACVWYPWWGAPPKPQRELVSEGTGEIGEDGTLAFKVDTAPALANHPDLDHLYTIEAEVVDASRRTITGSGTIKVTRQEFYAFAELDRGYYQPGQEIRVTVKALTANDTPVTAKGKLTVSAIRYQGERNTQVVEEPVETLDSSTDPDGNYTVTLKAGKSGQYKIAWEAKDSRGRPVVGAQVAWVAGADFQGASFRFNELEILSDKRTYEPGETAHLMINSSRPGASVLFSHRTDHGILTNYRVIALPSKSTVIDLPIEARDNPNFFVEATAVIDGKLRQEAREILVPPKEGVMNVEVTPDRPDYRPGDEATVRVKATTPEGKPVEAELAMTVFDKSVLYIQPETLKDVRAHYWGQKRSHGFQTASNLELVFQPLAYIQDPAQYVESDPAQDWHGSWGLRSLNFATDDLEGGNFAMAGALAEGPMKMKASSVGRAMAPSPASAPMAQESKSMAKDEAEADGGGRRERRDQAASPPPPPPPPQPAYKAAKVRAEFEDTAFWTPSVKTGESGEATVKFRMPENLTTWKVRALGMTPSARVGDASASVVTSKKFVLRLQAPRFFVERDRLTLSANLHNYLDKPKKAKVTLTVPEDLMELATPATSEVVIEAGKEVRVDWDVAVKKDGFAVIKMEGLTDEESDAVQMGFPVLVHGIEKTVSLTGLIRPAGAPFAELALEVPAERDPAASRLEVRFSPSLAGSMIDAVPYLLDYPYGCTEQTMSRFLPAVLVQRSLTQMGLSLDDLASKRTNLNSQELGDAAARYGRTPPLGEKPVFSQKVLADIVRAGLERISAFQVSGGGWGWWPEDKPSTYMTAYVLWGLTLATENDIEVDSGMLERGFRALENGVVHDLKDWKEAKGAWDEQAFLAYVLSLRKREAADLNAILMERRAHLSLYGKALLSLAMRKLGKTAEADLVLKNLRQYEKHDTENQTTWYDLPQDGWWYWWNNDVETHAWILKAVIAKDPTDEFAPGLVKWLLNNRKNGTYWRSTRDTAFAISSLVDYMRATKEIAPDFDLTVSLDGKPLKQVHVSRDTMFAFDNRISLSGDELTSGRHVLRVERKGEGAVYFSSYLTYFTKQEGISAAGLEVKVDRKYFKLVRSDKTETVQGSRLQDVAERRLRYERVPLASGDKLVSGDQLEVELRLTSKNDYDYLVFEDFKPAGCEPVDVRSGGRYGELCSNMELRDEKVAFFVTWLAQGEHLIKYRMRAEIPGTFHALPTKGWAMYAPEIRANADEHVLGIEDVKK